MKDTRPVLIGVGQQTWRDRDASRSLMDALTAVSRLALKDAGSPALSEAIDTVATVPFLAGLVPGLAELLPENPGSGLCERLGLSARTYTSHVGGNTPQEFINHFADELAAGNCRAVLISGGELIATLSAALGAGENLDHWRRGGSEAPRVLGKDRPGCSPVEQAHGMFEPITTYPMFESALRHARGWSREQHLAVLGGLVSRMSEVAAGNPYAWRREHWTPQQAIDTANRNRMITWPYTRVMNAILNVDMASAVIMTTAEQAGKLGVDPSRWVYLRGGSDGNDIWNVSERPVLHESPAIRRVVRQALEQASLGIEDMDCFDLYSCFPSAVQVACDALDIAIDDPRGVTLTGGLTLFGGPGNNYSLHAAIEIVNYLRAGRGRHGLLTANGNYLTKHSAGVYSTEPGPEAWPAQGRPDVQAELDRLAPVHVAEVPQGRGIIEAHAVAYDKGEPARGVVLGRLEDGQRFIANHVPGDIAFLQALAGGDLVGRQGQVSPAGEVNHFSLSD